MAEKILNTRIALKYDTRTNWEKDLITLKAGEIAIATLGPIKDGTTAGEINQHPVLFKVGDGTHKFTELPWASALAADVYSWAKQDKIDVQKAGTGNVVASIAWDASANGGKGGLKYETASVATAEGFEELQNALNTLTETVNGMYTNDQIDGMLENLSVHDTTYTDNQIAALSAEGGAIKVVADGLAELKGKVEDEDGALARANAAYELADAAQTASEVSDAITTAIEALDSTASQTAGADGLALTIAQVDGKVTAISGSIAANTYDAYGAASTAEENAKKYADDIKKEILTGDSTEELKEAYDTLVEIQQWIEGDGVNTTELTQAIAAETKAREDADKAINDTITSLGISNGVVAEAAVANSLSASAIVEVENILVNNAKSAQVVEENGVNTAAIQDKAVTADKLADDTKALFDAAGTAKDLVDDVIDRLVNDYTGDPSGKESIKVALAKSAVAAYCDSDNQLITETYATKEEVAALTTDDIAAGEKVWVFDCGNASDKLN